MFNNRFQCRFTSDLVLRVIWDGVNMHKWVLVTHCLTSNLSMEILENTENAHRLIVCCVITLSNRATNLWNSPFKHRRVDDFSLKVCTSKVKDVHAVTLSEGT